MQTYGDRMLRYIQTATKSSILIVYFNTTESPMVIERPSQTTIASNNYLLTSGPKGLWTYVYKLSDIQHLIYRNKTNVQAFVGYESAGGARFDMARIGNHITIGLKTKRNQLYLYTHLTKYTEEFDAHGGYTFDINHSQHFNIQYEEPFNRDAPLIPNEFVTGGSLSSAYQKEPEWLDVIGHIHKVYSGAQMGAAFVKHLGRRYKLQTGPRDGQYIQLGGQKKYVYQSGGFDMDLFRAAVQFVYDRVIKRVLEHYNENLEMLESKLLFDEKDAEFVVLFYDNPSVGTRRMYYLHLDELVRDYHDSVSSNVDKVQAVHRKYEQLYQNHVQSIEV